MGIIKNTIVTTSFLFTMVVPLTAQTQTWVEPFTITNEGIPENGTTALLYNVDQGMFLTKGTTWGTHAALTSNPDEALIYEIRNQGDYYQLYATNGGGTNDLLFVSNASGDPYIDWGATTPDVSYTYFNLATLSNGLFRIDLSTANGFYATLTDYCLGWNPSNIDVKEKDGGALGTNVGIFAVPATDDYAIEWSYYDYECYQLRKQLYELQSTYSELNIQTDDIYAIYINSSSTASDLSSAFDLLKERISDCFIDSLDITNYIINPTFTNNVNGWTVDMPAAQNKGYQSASYTNGDIIIQQFAEAWVPNGGTLGSGSISQTLTNLPDGNYLIEADIIACNQQTGDQVSGVELFAESETSYSTSVYTANKKPEHFSLLFSVSGGSLTIGLRTISTTANWIAIDNVVLKGFITSTPTSISVSPTEASIVEGQNITINASITTEEPSFTAATWSSSDEAVATVDNRGCVTALAQGTAIITAKAIGSDLSSSTLISVIDSDPSSLVINEIQVANIDMFIDPSFNYGGWIELYNPTELPINLGGLTISNGTDEWQFPSDEGYVPAQGYRNLWFDHYDTGNKYSDNAYKQVPFKLTYEGGTITLSDENGTEIASQSYPAAIQRSSYARTTDGGETWQLTSTPSPEASNIGSTFASTQLAAPVVDHDATVYTTAFTANVTIPEGATLRYTTDGSTPTLDNGFTSATGSFDVSGGTKIFRFRLYADGYLPSSVVTRTYIYNDKDYYLPIISVVTDEDNLYDDTIGAYTDGTNGTSGNNQSSSNKNRGWERPVNFEYLVPDGNDDGGSFIMALNQECDFEVCGGWSRHFYPASSFRLKGGKYYLGQNFLPYPFFEDKPYIKNKGLHVRNGGNDNYARIKDAAVHEIIIKSGFNLDCQATQPAHIFINGVYKFMFNIREPNNKNHGYSNYGIDTDLMDQFEINGSVGYEQKTGDDVAFRRWMTLAQQLAESPSDESIYNEICQIVDIDEYCNYMAAECYVGSSDWLTNSNNVKGYRSKEDGRFHLVFMDVDAAFSSTNMISSLASHLSDSRYDTGHNFLIEIFLNMLKHEGFKRRFIDAFCITAGSVFNPERSSEIITTMKDTAYKALSFDGNTSNLESSASSLINTISNSSNRSSRIENMRSYLGLNSNDAYNLTLGSNISSGTLWINNEEVPINAFSGTLYAPATLKATVSAGYRFKGWQMDGGTAVAFDSEPLFDIDSNWNYYDQGSLDDSSWNSIDYDTNGWSTGNAPFGYGNVGINGSADYATTLDYGTDSSQKRPTYYFRKTFSINELPTEDESYVLTYYVDDGFVAYVNGTEVGRYLMSGTPSYSSYTTTYVGATAATATITIPSELLIQGDNVIAVEVHNTSATSSDIYWTAKLEKHIRTEAEYISTEPTLDITTLSTKSATLTAIYERLSDDALLADIATPIKVNEVSAGNSVAIGDYFKKNDWIELFNTTDSDLNAAGLYLSDDLDDPLKYQIPSNSTINTIVPAHGHLIIWADKLDPITQLHTNFKLGNSDGQMALVTSSEQFIANNADYFSKHSALKDFADGLVYNTHDGDQSVGRYPDGANSFYQMTRPTIEKTNALHSYDTLIGEDEGIMDFTNATFTLDLAEGWNWVSHPLTDAIAVNLFDDYANRIQSQTLEAYYSSENQKLQGLLKRLTSGVLYKIEMSEAHTYSFNGQRPSKGAPIALHPGWNWIGYPLTGAQTLTAALANAKIDDGDIIIGQSGFAEYNSNDGWVGTLSSMVPGSGYLYYTSTTKALRFSSSASSIRLRKAKQQNKMSNNGLVSCDRHAYPNVMAVIGAIKQVDGQVPTNELTLAVYADGECRGIGQIIDGKQFLSIYGQGGEALTFKAFDEMGAIYDVSEVFEFSPDMVGSLAKPYTFTLASTPTAIDVAIATAHTNRPTGYYNLSGQLVATKPNHLRSGIYIVRLSNGQCQKLMVK